MKIAFQYGFEATLFYWNRDLRFLEDCRIFEIAYPLDQDSSRLVTVKICCLVVLLLCFIFKGAPYFTFVLPDFIKEKYNSKK